MNSVIDTPDTALMPREDACVKVNSKTRTAPFQCLVVSGQPQRRELLARAAEHAGWETVECADARNGWMASQRSLFRLAVIDLAEWGSDGVDEVRQLAERLARASGLLMMMCGNECDALEEIWARQLGAWLYLPGMGEEADIEMLCREARPIAERLTGVGKQSAEYAA